MAGRDYSPVYADGDASDETLGWQEMTGWIDALKAGQGRKAAWRGEYAQARQKLEKSRQDFERLGDVLATVWPRFELGSLAVLQRDYYYSAKSRLKGNP